MRYTLLHIRFCFRNFVRSFTFLTHMHVLGSNCFSPNPSIAAGSSPTFIQLVFWRILFYYSSIVGRLELASSLALVLTSFCQWVVKCPNRYSECNKFWSEKVWSSIVRQEKQLEDSRVETSNGDDALVQTGGR